MAISRQTVSETLAETASRRPVLQPVLAAFTPLLEARAALPEKLAPMLEESDFSLPPWRPERAQQGVPLLAGASLNGLFPLRRRAGITSVHVILGTHSLLFLYLHALLPLVALEPLQSLVLFCVALALLCVLLFCSLLFFISFLLYA